MRYSHAFNSAFLFSHFYLATKVKVSRNRIMKCSGVAFHRCLQLSRILVTFYCHREGFSDFGIVFVNERRLCSHSLIILLLCLFSRFLLIISFYNDNYCLLLCNSTIHDTFQSTLNCKFLCNFYAKHM